MQDDLLPFLIFQRYGDEIMFGELLHQPQIYYFTICKLFKTFNPNIFIFWSSFCTLDTYCKIY